MTLQQEFLGWKVTMQSWDFTMHLAAHGTEEDLKSVVAVPKDFIKHRKELALVFTDQVPVWLARKKAKVVFAEHEKVKSSRHSKKMKGGGEVITKVQDIQKSQNMPPKLQELADRAAKEGMSQTISGGGGEG